MKGYFQENLNTVNSLLSDHPWCKKKQSLKGHDRLREKSRQRNVLTEKRNGHLQSGHLPEVVTYWKWSLTGSCRLPEVVSYWKWSLKRVCLKQDLVKMVANCNPYP